MSKKVRNNLKYRKIALTFAFIALPISVFNMLVFKNEFLAILGSLLLLIFFIMTFFFWRCPKCKKRLPLRFDKEADINDWYQCPYCNTKFSDGEIID